METKDFLEALLSNSQLDNKRVFEVFKDFCEDNTNELLRLYSYISRHTDFPEIPETSKVRKNATFRNYHISTDRVVYSYDQDTKVKVSETDVIHEGYVFNNWDECRQFRDTHKGDTEITVFYKTGDTCKLSTWMCNS